MFWNTHKIREFYKLNWKIHPSWKTDKIKDTDSFYFRIYIFMGIFYRIFTNQKDFRMEKLDISDNFFITIAKKQKLL